MSLHPTPRDFKLAMDRLELGLAMAKADVIVAAAFIEAELDRIEAHASGKLAPKVEPEP